MTAIFQEWHYPPALLSKDGRTVDRLSLYLSLRDTKDERLEGALKQALEGGAIVEGLTIFRNRFRGLEDCYVLIGGTACDLWMGERELAFRATKDLDIVLVVESLRPEFFRSFG